MAASKEDIYTVELMETIAASDYMRDVTLIAGRDGQRFRVHRVVMAAASEYFKTLFGLNFQDGRENEMFLREIDGSMLKLIIDFCYTGHIILTEANVNDILEAASCMELTKLERKCHEFSEIMFFGNNLITIPYDLKKLRQKSLKAICKVFGNVPIDGLQKIVGDIFCEIPNDDEAAAKEAIIFDRLMVWLDENEADGAKFATKLLNAIKLKHVPAEFLREKLEPLCEKYGCMKLLVDEYRERPFDTAVRLLRQDSTDNIFCARYDSSCWGLNIYKYDLGSNEWIEYRTIEAKNESRWCFANGNLFEFESGTLMAYSCGLNALNKILLPRMIHFRNRVQPIAADEHVYVFGDSSHRCERFNTHFRMWESLTPYSYNLPTDAVVLDGVIFFCSKDMLCYNTKTNKWSKLSPNFQDNGKITSMFASKSYLYVTIEHRHLYKYETGSNTLTKLKSFERPLDTVCKTIEYQGNIYGFTNRGYFGIVTPEGEVFFKCLNSKLDFNSIQALFVADTDMNETQK